MLRANDSPLPNKTFCGSCATEVLQKSKHERLTNEEQVMTLKKLTFLKSLQPNLLIDLNVIGTYY